MNHMRSQSAMEYLMTYGWAILIIAVILGALYQVGVFNPYTFSPKAGAGACKIARGLVDEQVTSSKVGTCNNALPQYVGQFSGSAYVSASDAGLPAGSAARTMTLWVKTLSAGNAFLWYGTNACTGKEVFFDSSLGYLQFESACNDAGTFTSIPSVSDNAWHMLAFTYSAGSTSITGCVDAQCATKSLGGAVALATVPGGSLWIGRDIYSYLTGQEANIQIYNASLSANEINSLYKEGIGGAPIDTSNLVGWWPLNGNANDYSGNGNNGTPTNMVFAGSWMAGYSAP